MFSGHGGAPRHPVRGHGVPRGSSRRYLSAVPDRDRYHRRYHAGSVLAGDVGALGDNQGGGGRRTSLDGDDDLDHRRRAMAYGQSQSLLRAASLYDGGLPERARSVQSYDRNDDHAESDASRICGRAFLHV